MVAPSNEGQQSTNSTADTISNNRGTIMSTKYQEFHRRSIEQPEAFWGEQAEFIHWHKPFEKVLDYSQPPFAKWFVGGETNLCYNAVDRHLAERGNQNALIFVSTETDETRLYTFQQLHEEVNRVAAMLQSLGVGRGDRVLIYMPMIPEALFAMLATVRIGAIHSVVFGGFASPSLATRIDDAQPKVMVTAYISMRGDKPVPYKHLVDEALRLSKYRPKQVVIVNRGLDKGTPLIVNRDLDDAALRQLHLNASRDRYPLLWCRSQSTRL